MQINIVDNIALFWFCKFLYKECVLRLPTGQEKFLCITYLKGWEFASSEIWCVTFWKISTVHMRYLRGYSNLDVRGYLTSLDISCRHTKNFSFMKLYIVFFYLLIFLSIFQYILLYQIQRLDGIRKFSCLNFFFILFIYNLDFGFIVLFFCCHIHNYYP